MNFNYIEQVTEQVMPKHFQLLHISKYSKGAVVGIAWGRYPDGYLNSKACCWE